LLTNWWTKKPVEAKLKEIGNLRTHITKNDNVSMLIIKAIIVMQDQQEKDLKNVAGEFWAKWRISILPLFRVRNLPICELKQNMAWMTNYGRYTLKNNLFTPAEMVCKKSSS
jgi:hypothetical protein